MKRLSWCGIIGWFVVGMINTCLPVKGEESFAAGGFAVGVRGGVSDDRRVWQTEAAFEHWFRKGFVVPDRWSLRPGVHGAVGWIGDGREVAPIGSLGPGFRLASFRYPVAVVGGLAPTLVGKNRLGGRNLGAALEFTSHIGLRWRVKGRLDAGYRFQHMSNAGLGSDNPGLNLVMLDLHWRH